MKHIILIILAILIFSSCDPFFMFDMEYDIDITGTGIHDLNSLAEWILDNIDYVTDPIENWQTPQETWDLRTGDCDDLAILFMYIAYEFLNYENPQFLIIKNKPIDHAISKIKINSKKYFYFNLLNDQTENNIEILWIFQYHETLFFAEYQR